jgi:hypothetical protein
MPGWWLPTLWVGASKKNTSSSSIGSSSRYTLISEITRHGRSVPGAVPPFVVAIPDCNARAMAAECSSPSAAEVREVAQKAEAATLVGSSSVLPEP